MVSLDATKDLLGLFADSTRLRLLALLSREELTVAELVQITAVGQSRVSTHLGRLKEAGLLRDRRTGASTHYALNQGALTGQAARLWELLSSEVNDALLTSDRERCAALLAARADEPSWPDSIAGQMDRHYSPGRTWEATARGLLGFVRLGDVLDIGSGDGVNAALLASRARSYTCLDKSPRMISAARERLRSAPAVRFEVGDMHDLPFAAQTFDAALLFNVLAYSERPQRALSEAARVLRPGGSLALIALAAHGHQQVTRGYGHVNPGLDATQLARTLRRAGLHVESCEVSSREPRVPHFEVITAFATRRAAVEES